MTEQGPDPETYGDYSVDDEDQAANLADVPGPEGADEADLDHSPPEQWSTAQGFGNTPYEEATGESLDQRVAQERPEPDPYAESGPVATDVDPDVDPDGTAASAEEAAVHVVPEDEDL